MTKIETTESPCSERPFVSEKLSLTASTIGVLSAILLNSVRMTRWTTFGVVAVGVSLGITATDSFPMPREAEFL
jgi:hypothetical protein